MNRLRKIAIVVGLFAFLLSSAAAEAGIFRRCRNRSCGNGKQAAAQYSATYGRCPTGTTCPIYVWANHGSYCSFYALACSTTTSNSACNFDCACGSPAGTDCNSCGNTPCTCVGATYGTGEDAHHKVRTELGDDGMQGPLVVEAELDVFDKRKVKPIAPHTDYNGFKVTLTTRGGKKVLVQIWGMKVDPMGHMGQTKAVPCYIGHQIHGDPAGDMVVGTPIGKFAYTFDYKGNTYTVITHKGSP